MGRQLQNMMKSSTRSLTMRAALKRIVLPALHERGFTGKLPELRRVGPTGTHLFTVQVSKWGGEFIVELGRAPAGPYTTVTGEVVEPTALACYDLRHEDRARLRAVPHIRREVWFRYAPSFRDRLGARLARLVRRSVDPKARGFERAARAVLALLPECDQWWTGANGLPHVRSFVEQERAQWGGAMPPSMPPGASDGEDG